MLKLHKTGLVYDCYVIKILCAASHACSLYLHVTPYSLSRTQECSPGRTKCDTSCRRCSALRSNKKKKKKKMHKPDFTRSRVDRRSVFCRCTRGAATCADSSATSAAPSPCLSRQRCVHPVVKFGHMHVYFVLFFIFTLSDINVAVSVPHTIW